MVSSVLVVSSISTSVLAAGTAMAIRMTTGTAVQIDLHLGVVDEGGVGDRTLAICER